MRFLSRTGVFHAPAASTVNSSSLEAEAFRDGREEDVFLVFLLSGDLETARSRDGVREGASAGDECALRGSRRGVLTCVFEEACKGVR